MLRFHLQEFRSDGREIVRLWVLADGAQCVLASTGDAFELRLIHGVQLVRRVGATSFEHARALAERWRVEYELEHDARAVGASTSCPECGEDAFPAALGAGRRSLWCRSCGHAWYAATEDPRR